MGSKAGDCSCFTGTAVVDGNGNCRCVNESGSQMYPVMTANAPQRTPKVYYPFGQMGRRSTPEPAAVVPSESKTPSGVAGGVADDSIFGMSPLVILGLGAAGLYLLSQMGDTKKQ